MEEVGGDKRYVSGLWIHFADKKVIKYFYSGFEKDPRKSRFEIQTRVPTEVLNGKYNLDGQILVIPIRGHGVATLTFGKYTNTRNNNV